MPTRKRSARFETGKLPMEFLRALLERIEIRDRRVAIGPRIGEDAAAIDFGDRYLIAKTDPITFATDEIGWYTVHVNANDIATMGARPKWLLVTALLPEGRTDERLVEKIFRDLRKSCETLGVTLCGGHCEITHGLDRPILCGQMLGEVAKDKLVRGNGALSGDALLLTKGIAIEGTALIARELAAKLGRTFSPHFLARARGYLRNPGISVVRDALGACRAGGVHAMHDPTEGGLAQGVHEMAAAAGLGVEVDANAIHIYSHTRKLCAEFGLDPLGLIASGALLIAAAPGRAGRICRALSRDGIRAARIGTFTPASQGVRLITAGGVADLPRFDRDEVTRLL